MFPKTAELHQEGKQSKPLLYKSLGMIGLVVVPAVLIYFLIPGFIVNLLYGKEYMVIAPLLGWFALFMGLTCFVYMIAFYKVSINHRAFLWIMGVFNVFEILGIWLFHESLMQVIYVLIMNMFLLFAILMINITVMKDD